ncbi:MAG TPA: redoxin domain-containing protein [Pyrinomonadaceae bacterium]|jgi:peroxiredoxin|nr:redoxin domain-containing protein [Pyrinomonadaceae bacterium]
MPTRKTSLACFVFLILAIGGGCKSSGSGSGTGEAVAKASAPSRPRIDRSVPELAPAINNPLPEARLVDINGGTLPEESLRRGKVVLMFLNPTCAPCNTEAEFLRTVIDKRRDISFYGVATLGAKEESLKMAAELFPFKTFYDEDGLLTKNLGITRMPIKIFVENGVVKESWGGASKSPEVQADFVKWMEEVK